MTCLPRAGKCEWEDLKHFVAHLNKERMATFQHSCCLDISGSEKQPEVLCKDEFGHSLVIERKGIFWPPDYVQRHKIEHNFWELLIQMLNGEDTRRAPYSLRVSSPGIVNDQELKRIALELSVILKPILGTIQPGEGVRFKQPIPVELWREFPGERDPDDPETGLGIHSQEPEYAELLDPAAIPTEFTETLRKHFDSAREKFLRYANSKRILLLNFVSIQLHMQLDQPWWIKYFESRPQQGIDEIWATFEYGKGDWGFERLC